MQQPYQPDLDLLKQALGSHVQECHAELIKTTLPWSLVYRVTLLTQGHSSHESVIVKAINPQGLNDPLEAEREPNFYKILYPKINIPKPIIHLVTTDPASGWHMIVIEDLSLTHRIPKHPYQWVRDELRSVLPIL